MEAGTTKSSHLDLQAGGRDNTLRMGECFQTSKATPGDTPPAIMPHSQSFPSRSTNLGPSTQTYKPSTSRSAKTVNTIHLLFLTFLLEMSRRTDILSIGHFDFVS